MKITLPLLMLSTTILLAACGTEPVPPVSKGQQLNDLQQAYQNRAITDEEYKDQKEKILDK